MKIWSKNKLSRRFGKYCRKQNNFRISCFFSKERGCVNGIVGYGVSAMMKPITDVCTECTCFDGGALSLDVSCKSK